MLSVQNKGENDSYEDHSHTKYLPECEPRSAKEVPYLDIGISDKFSRKSKDTISRKKPDSHLSWICYIFLFPEK